MIFLQIVIAGTLWSTLDDDSFGPDIDKLVSQIQTVVPDVDEEGDEATTVTMTTAELRAEFERLRHGIESADLPRQAVSFDPSQPALLAPSVPALPPDFRETPAIKWLRDTLLRRGAPEDCAKTRVGFWGMGGIGKTVTGAALARDHDIRMHFDQIVWLPLGQTPVMLKLQTSAMQQLTGEDIKPDTSEAERHELLRRGMRDKKILLCLDDLW